MYPALLTGENMCVVMEQTFRLCGYLKFEVLHTKQNVKKNHKIPFFLIRKTHRNLCKFFLSPNWEYEENRINFISIFPRVVYHISLALASDPFTVSWWFCFSSIHHSMQKGRKFQNFSFFAMFYLKTPALNFHTLHVAIVAMEWRKSKKLPQKSGKFFVNFFHTSLALIFFLLFFLVFFSQQFLSKS